MDLGLSTETVIEARLSEHSASETFDGLIIVNTESTADVSIEDILEKTMASVTSSCGTITVYTRHFEQASELQKRFRLAKDCINVTMTETFFREHQVMDQRTHPLMQSEVHLFQGFIVSCMKVKE
jgi:tRNA A58 N-methylase Trm61